MRCGTASVDIGSSRRRLLLLIPWMEVGGADRFNLDLLGAVRERSWQTTIVTTLPSTNPWHDRFARKADEIVVLDKEVRPGEAASFLENLVSRRHPTIVLVTQSEAGYLALPALRATAPDAAFIDVCHSVAPDWMDGGYPRYSLRHTQYLDLTIATSADLKSWLVERGADPTTVEVCYTNVDTDRWRPDPASRSAVREELYLAEDTPIVLYAARLSDEKAPLTALEVIARLGRGGRDLMCVVAGDGPLREHVKHFIAQHHLGRIVHVEGAVSQERMRKLVAAADLFMLPSRSEGIALTLFEALACEVPVVASDVGGQRELVTPDVGILVEPGEDFEARFASAVDGLLGDDDLRRKLGRDGRERVRAYFTMGEMSARIATLFELGRARHRTLNVARSEIATSAKALTTYLSVTWGQPPTTASRLDRTYARAAAIGLPVYRWARRRGWIWPARLVAAVRRRILRQD